MDSKSDDKAIERVSSKYKDDDEGNKNVDFKGSKETAHESDCKSGSVSIRLAGSKDEDLSDYYSEALQIDTHADSRVDGIASFALNFVQGFKMYL